MRVQCAHIRRGSLTSAHARTLLQAFYWATSEWSAQEIEEAFRASGSRAPRFAAVSPGSPLPSPPSRCRVEVGPHRPTRGAVPASVCTQSTRMALLLLIGDVLCSMFHRERPEKEYA